MPAIFISHSHDNDAHAARVLALSDRLIADGLECVLDQYIGAQLEGWPRRIDRQIKAANPVLIVCTEIYYKRVTWEEKQSIGLGVKWEGRLIYQHLYQGETLNEKFIIEQPPQGQIKQRTPQGHASSLLDAPFASPEVSLGSLPVTGSDLFGRDATGRRFASPHLTGSQRLPG